MRTVTYRLQTVDYDEHGEVFEVVACETWHAVTGDEHRRSVILSTPDRAEAEETLQTLVSFSDLEA